MHGLMRTPSGQLARSGSLRPGLVRRPCATKASRKISKPCATKTVHKTFEWEKPCAGLVRLVGFLREVLCEPCGYYIILYYIIL